MTKIDKNFSYYPDHRNYEFDKGLAIEELVALYDILQQKNYLYVEEELAFRNGFVERKNYGKEYATRLDKECVLICNYMCQGKQKGRYTFGYNDDLGDEEDSVIFLAMEKYNYKTIEEQWAFKKGFVARRKFGTRVLRNHYTCFGMIDDPYHTKVN